MAAKKELKKKTGIFRSLLRFPKTIVKETWDEALQVGVLYHALSLIGIKRGDGKMNKDDKEVGSIGQSSRVLHAFSDKDEIKYGKLLAEFRKQCSDDPESEKKFVRFVKEMVSLGYDEDTLRIRLIGYFKEKTEEDYAIQTMKVIVEMDGQVDDQVEFAVDRKLLVKKPFKSFSLWMWRNKFTTLLWIIVFILGSVVVFSLLMDVAFG